MTSRRISNTTATFLRNNSTSLTPNDFGTAKVQRFAAAVTRDLNRRGEGGAALDSRGETFVEGTHLIAIVELHDHTRLYESQGVYV